MAIDIIALTDEYIQEGGMVSIEFATTPHYLAKISGSLTAQSQRLTDLKSRWVVYECSTCTEYHGPEFTLHASIETTSFLPVGEEGVVFDAAT